MTTAAYLAAEGGLRRAAEQAPNDPERLFRYGEFLLKVGRPWRAVAVLERASAASPDRLDILTALGGAHLDAGGHRKTIAIFDALFRRTGSAEHRMARTLAKAVAKDFTAVTKALAGDPESYRILIVLLHERQAVEQAAWVARKAIALWPGNPDAWNFLGVLDAERGRAAEAVKAYEKSLNLAPGNVEALFNLGNALASLGDADRARTTYRQAISAAPAQIDIARNYVDITRMGPDDPVIATLEAGIREAGPDVGGRAAAHYALGKAYDDQGRFGDAVDQFVKGGALMASQRPYGYADEVALLERMPALFDGLDIPAAAAGGNPSEKPVFIVGLPRSGTTLAEQILAAHPSIHAAGELQHFRNAVLEHVDGRLGRRTLPIWEFTDRPVVTPDAIAAAAKTYLERTSPLAPNARRIVDKQPMNDRYVGLIALAFPNAAIVHCVRDIRDTAVSCLSKNFDGEIAFTDGFEAVAAYAQAQRKMMTVWERLFPGRVHTLVYEDLVADVGAKARDLVGWLGLDWTDRCLDFMNVERSVDTASAQQVRQGIYDTSIGRWRRYLPHIQPLVDSLEGL